MATGNSRNIQSVDERLIYQVYRSLKNTFRIDSRNLEARAVTIVFDVLQTLTHYTQNQAQRDALFIILAKEISTILLSGKMKVIQIGKIAKQIQILVVPAILSTDGMPGAYVNENHDPFTTTAGIIPPIPENSYNLLTRRFAQESSSTLTILPQIKRRRT